MRRVIAALAGVLVMVGLAVCIGGAKEITVATRSS